MIFKKLLQNTRTTLASAVALPMLACVLAVSVLGCTPAQKQTAVQIITEINGKIPEIQSAADTVAAVVSALDPASATLIQIGDTAFDAATSTLGALTKAYLANPNATTLQQIEAAINSLESSVNTATLNAVGIKDLAKQRLAIAALKTFATAITIAFGLISSLESIAQLEQLRSTGTIRLARLRPYLDEHELRQAAAESGVDLDRQFRQAEAFGF